MRTHKILTDIEIDCQLSGLSSVFNKLRELVDEYCRMCHEDAPYWYNERANVSFLAGAVWRCEGMALEEFSSDKIWEKEEYPGRTDIWFKYAGIEYIGEAKITWPDLNKDLSNVLKEARQEFDNAVTDATNNPEKADCKLALLFLVPSMQQGESGEQLASFLLSVKEELKPDFFVPIFPKAASGLLHKGCCYPGVVVLGRKVA